MVDAEAVTFLIADFSGRAVVRLTSAGRVEGARSHGVEQAETLPLAGTRLRAGAAHAAGRRRAGRRRRTADRPGHRPRGRHRPAGDDAARATRSAARSPTSRSAAHALAYVVIAARQHTDVFEWGQRSTPFALAAEIQRRLLPASYTCEAGQFTLAGWLEPAAAVGGDTFDYTLDRDVPAGVDHRRRRPPGGGRAAGHPARRRPAQRAPEGARPRRAGALRQRLARRELARRASSSPGSCCGWTCSTGARGDRQRRAPLPAPAARRPGGGDHAAHRGALRRHAGQVLRACSPSRSSRATGSCC